MATVLAADYFPPPDDKGGWRTISDAAKIRKVTGIDTRKLDEAFEYIQHTSQHGGLLVVRHGYLVYERYFGRGHREALPELASCGKAFTSHGHHTARKASLIPNGLDEKVFSPKYLPKEYFPLDDPRKAEIWLGQVLSMSAGIRGTNPAYVKGVRQTWENPAQDGPYSTTDDVAMNQPLWCAPGECYSYSTSSSHIPAMILRHLTGMEMEDFMRQKLTGPLGFGTWGYAMYRPKLKGGSGGYVIYVVPSLDMVIYKMGGTEGQYDPALTRLPVKYTYDGSRANWKAGDPKVVGDATGKTLQLVVAAVSQ